MGHGPQQQCHQNQDANAAEDGAVGEVEQVEGRVQVQRHDKHVGHGHGQGAQAREPGEGDEPRARRAALVVAQKRHDDEDENDDAPGFGDADGCSAGKVVGEGDEPHGHGEKSHGAHERKLEAFAFFKQKGDAREQSDKQRGDKGRLGEIAEGRSGRVAGQRREKRAGLREERYGEQAEQKIRHEYRDDDRKLEYAGQGRGFRRGAGGLCCVGGGFGAFVAGVVARRVVRVRLWFGKLHCQPQTYGDGRHQAGAEQQNAARRQAKHNKGDTGPKQRSHDSKKRDVRRLSGKGKPPEVSGRSQGGAEQHVASDHGHCRLFEKHPRPQQDSNACGEGRQKRQHGCCEGAAGPRKERHPEGAPAAFRHRKASCKA
nr:hypothetical protein [uncultured Adlercreutzia sp.]